MVTLVVAANLPDIDALTYLASADVALGLRRGWTHGVLAVALLPILLAGAVAAFDRRRRSAAGQPAASFYRLLPLAYLGVASHPLLDWLNTYGIRLLMPFDGRWFYGDTLFIIDPWLWLVLGGAVFLRHSASRRGLLTWSALALVTTLIFVTGSDGDPGARALWFLGLAILAALRIARRQRASLRGCGRPAATALVAAALYTALLYAGSTAARHDVESRLTAAGTRVENLMIGPLPIRPLRHAVVVDTGAEYRVGTYDWLAAPRLELDDTPLVKPPATDVVAAAWNSPCLEGMVGWVRFPWVEIEPTGDGGHVVHLMDARYALKRTTGFGAGSVRLGPDLSDACDRGESVAGPGGID